MTADETTAAPLVRSRTEHGISRRDIDPAALRVLYRLHRAGYTAYLVGGSVRDLLLGRKPKDFDVGTNATPRQIKGLFRQAYIIGRRFRLVHVKFGDKTIETCTFRSRETSGSPVGTGLFPADVDGHPDDHAEDPPEPAAFPSRHGRRHFPAPDDPNLYGSPAEDAFRRDFTVNGLFYDIATRSVIDHVGGLEDLSYRRLRTIGDADRRFVEDPVRMLRAVRFAARLGFHLEARTEEALRRHHGRIVEASPPRLFEEVLRLFSFSAAAAAFRRLWETGLMADLFPEIAEAIDHSGGGDARCWTLLAALDRNDSIVPVATVAMQMAALYWEPLMDRLQRAGGARTPRRLHDTVLSLVGPGAERLHFPKRLRHELGAILVNQFQFDEDRSPAARQRFAEQAFFPAALAFREIRQDALGHAPEALEPWLLLADQYADRHEILNRNAPPMPRFEPMTPGSGGLAGFEALAAWVAAEEAAATAPVPIATAAPDRPLPVAAPVATPLPAPVATVPVMPAAPVLPVSSATTPPDSGPDDAVPSRTANAAAPATGRSHGEETSSPALSRSARRRRNRRLKRQQERSGPTLPAPAAVPAPTVKAEPASPIPADPKATVATTAGTPGKESADPSSTARPAAPTSESSRRSRRNRRGGKDSSGTPPVAEATESPMPAHAVPATPTPVPPPPTPATAAPTTTPAAAAPAKEASSRRRGRGTRVASTGETQAAAASDPKDNAKKDAPKTGTEKTESAPRRRNTRKAKTAAETPESSETASAQPPASEKPPVRERRSRAAAAPSPSVSTPAPERRPAPTLDPNQPLTVASFFRRRDETGTAESAGGTKAKATATRPAAVTGMAARERPSRHGRSGRAATRVIPAREEETPTVRRPHDEPDAAPFDWMDEV